MFTEFCDDAPSALTSEYFCTDTLVFPFVQLVGVVLLVEGEFGEGHHIVFNALCHMFGLLRLCGEHPFEYDE